tara:strand:+ start:397 stop:738 length:342 start_codon:yes stop_codon:yes gene_type:complete
MEDGKRSFTVVELRKSGQKGKKGTAKKTASHGGRYVSKSPDGAARKAFTAACRSKAIRGQCTLDVVLKETTRGQNGKTYKYKLKRVKLDKPRIIKKGDVEIKIEYEVKVSSMN